MIKNLIACFFPFPVLGSIWLACKLDQQGKSLYFLHALHIEKTIISKPNKIITLISLIHGLFQFAELGGFEEIKKQIETAEKVDAPVRMKCTKLCHETKLHCLSRWFLIITFCFAMITIIVAILFYFNLHFRCWLPF